MASLTTYFGLTKLAPNESTAANNYAFISSNLDTIDRLLGKLHEAVFVEETPIDNPTAGPTLTLEEGGNIRAGQTVRYKFTYVDEYGAETAASIESIISTPAPISTPSQPSLVVSSSGGTLLAGSYFYRLTAYTDANTLETIGSSPANITIQSGSTNSITVNLPTLPGGADGFNVYRRAPGESNYYYIASVDMTVATPPSSYLDNGSSAPNCNRTPPTQNLTNSNNKIIVTLPGATPTVPEGYTWKVYRTFSAGNYNSSLLQWVTTETSPGSGVIVPYVEDTGQTTTVGSPPTISSITGDTSRIDAWEELLDEVAERSNLTWGTAVESGLEFDGNDYPGWHWSDAATPQAGAWEAYNVSEDRFWSIRGWGPPNPEAWGEPVIWMREDIRVEDDIHTQWSAEWYQVAYDKDMDDYALYYSRTGHNRVFTSDYVFGQFGAFAELPNEDVSGEVFNHAYLGTTKEVRTIWDMWNGSSLTWLEAQIKIEPDVLTQHLLYSGEVENRMNLQVDIDGVNFSLDYDSVHKFELDVSDVGGSMTLTAAPGQTDPVIFASSSATPVSWAALEDGRVWQYSPILTLTANYNMDGTEWGTTLVFDSATPVTLLLTPVSGWLDTDAFPPGSQVKIVQAGAGQVNVLADTGVTLQCGATYDPDLREQWAVATLINLGQDNWVITGDLAESP